MQDGAVRGVFVPEILPLKNFDQKNYHHIYDVLTHTAVAVESCPVIPQLRMAALLHDFGKPGTFTVDEKGVGHFYGHGDVSYDIAKAILRRLKVSGDDYNLISTLVRYHDTAIAPSEKSVRRALNKYGEDTLKYLLLLKRADNAGQNIQLFNRKEEYVSKFSLTVRRNVMPLAPFVPVVKDDHFMSECVTWH